MHAWKAELFALSLLNIKRERLRLTSPQYDRVIRRILLQYYFGVLEDWEEHSIPTFLRIYKFVRFDSFCYY